MSEKVDDPASAAGVPTTYDTVLRKKEGTGVIMVITIDKVLCAREEQSI